MTQQQASCQSLLNEVQGTVKQMLAFWYNSMLEHSVSSQLPGVVLLSQETTRTPVSGLGSRRRLVGGDKAASVQTNTLFMAPRVMLAPSASLCPRLYPHPSEWAKKYSPEIVILHCKSQCYCQLCIKKKNTFQTMTGLELTPRRQPFI